MLPKWGSNWGFPHPEVLPLSGEEFTEKNHQEETQTKKTEVKSDHTAVDKDIVDDADKENTFANDNMG